MTHAELVRNLTKPGKEIASQMDENRAQFMHMAIGVAGEAGELLDAMKRVVIYNKFIDLDNVIEELGDMEFYLEGLRQGLGISRELVLEANIAKLQKRYASGTYTDKAAQDREDKSNG